MDTNQFLEGLMCFGMTKQEATLYLALAQNGELTGYEAAKQTGISRSNAYNALAGLVDKGAAYTAEGAAVRYHIVDIEEFCSNKIRALEGIKLWLKEHMPEPKAEMEGYLTITGDCHIQDKIKNMIAASGQRIYISMAKQLLQMFEKEILKAVRDGKKVVILTDKPYKMEGAILYETQGREYQIGVIADSSKVLTGEFGRGEASVCLYSGQPNFVQVFKDYLRNEIKLIELLKGE